MIVYRYLLDKELELYKNNEVESLGSYFITNRFACNFKYDNQRYISFFKEKQDVINYQKANGNYYGNNNFIAWFDIPEKNLGETYIGNYSFNPKCEQFILLARNFDCSWLKGYVSTKNSVKEEELEA